MKFSQWVSSIAEAGLELLGKGGSAKKSTIQNLCEQLRTSRGEALGTALAYEVVQEYTALDAEGRLGFFTLLVKDYDINPEDIIKYANQYAESVDTSSYKLLSQVVEAPRKSLFRRINVAPNGTATLVQMRNDLLQILPTHPELGVIDVDLKSLMASWFNRGFLTLEQISWQTPAHILEKLIAYEAVHEMSGWEDLRRRLADDRRCFAFFHPALDAEPLIFVEVALVKGIAGNIHHLLADESTEAEKHDPDTAVFYSISNCQAGLKGISFGNFLIKQVVAELQRDCPELKHFVTLSPIPGFSTWLKHQIDEVESELIRELDFEALEQLRTEGKYTQETQHDSLKPALMKLCAHYLYLAKKGIQPLDPVARFHLGNGAQIENLNWLGDSSKNGLAQSYGMLVNYAYRLDKVESNHEALVNQGTIVSSSRFQKHLK